MNWQSAVERTVTGLGYELVDTERTAGGLLRVYIDNGVGQRGDAAPGALADIFITVDDCEKVTRQLQHVLEVEGCAYERLEVSSPGLDRPLKTAADYARFAGEQIALTLKQPFQGRKKYQGELQATEAGWSVVFSEGKAQSALGFVLDEVKEARLVPVLDFKGRRFAKPALEAAQETTQGITQGMTQEMTQEMTLEKTQETNRDKAQPSKKGSNVEVDGGRIQ